MRIGLDMREFRGHQLIDMANIKLSSKEKKELEEVRKIFTINVATGCGLENAKYFLLVYPDVYLVIFEILKKKYHWFSKNKRFKLPSSTSSKSDEGNQKKFKDVKNLVEGNLQDKEKKSLIVWLDSGEIDDKELLSDFLEKKITHHFEKILKDQFIKNWIDHQKRFSSIKKVANEASCEFAQAKEALTRSCGNVFMAIVIVLKSKNQVQKEGTLLEEIKNLNIKDLKDIAEKSKNETTNKKANDLSKKFKK